MTVIKPPRLRKGSTIGLVAPASTPSSEEKIEKGVAYLEQLGYRVKLGEHIRKMHGYLAGTDEERAADFNTMVRDKDVKAIFTIRGGYGTPRILKAIDYRSLKNNPKIIVGYSDITALQLALFRKIGLVTFSGPMTGTDMWKDFDPYTEENFWRLLTSTKMAGLLLKNPDDDPLKILKHGIAHGRLLGGNLSLVTNLIGTPYLPNLDRSILFLEDVEESPYRIDRMLSQVLHAGVFHTLAGLVFGKFTDCHPARASEPHLPVGQIQEEYAEKITCPIVANFQYGHIARKLTVPIGVQARINTTKNIIELLESPVS